MGASKNEKITTALIDEAMNLYVEVAKANKRLDEIKATVKKAAAATDNKREFEGTLGKLVVVNTTSWIVDYKDLASWLKRNKKPDMIEHLVTVKPGEIKKVFGESVLEEIGTKIVGGQTVRFTKF